jgi:hypothetical protein
VIEPDVREPHDLSVEDVRRIEPPAEAGLEADGIDVRLDEREEGDRGQHLELGRPLPQLLRDVVRRVEHPAREPIEAFGRDRDAVDLHALLE